MPWASRAWRRVGPFALGLLAAWIALHAFGHEAVTLGPFRVRFDAVFGRPLTDIRLPPLGRVVARTHASPLHVAVTLQDLGVQQLPTLLKHGSVTDLVDSTLKALPSALLGFGLRLAAVSAAAGAALGLLVYRRIRPALVATLTALLVVAGCEAGAWATYRQDAFNSPTFTGSLRIAPTLVGPIRGAAAKIEAFRTELADIISGTLRVYQGANGGATGDGAEIRVLHISDVHLSPLGLDFAREVADGFDVDMVLDTGDLTSFGTHIEQLITAAIPQFHRPYVWVRGNHDSRAVQSEMETVKNAVVLDGMARGVGGLVIYGLGDPAFTPNKNAPLDDETVARTVESAAGRVSVDLTRLRRPPDIVAVHDDRMVESLGGLMPLVVSGHFHRTSARVVNGTLFLRIGSTGGSGANVFRQEGGIPLTAEILHFSKAFPHVLLGWDVVVQSPESASITITRHVTGPGEAVESTPSGSPPKSPSASP